MIDSLVINSKSALISAIEIHNKPIFPYRYEVVCILVINAWELLFKAYLLKNHPEIKVMRDDGTTKPFEECLESVRSSIGKPFFATAENVSKIYEYRCNSIHFYQDNIDILIFSLTSMSVAFYSDFILSHFGIDLADETNLNLLPIGFKKPISPIIFLSNHSASESSSEAVKQFIKSIIISTDLLIENGIEEAILVEYQMSLINENRIKNADLKAAITQDKSQASGTLTVTTPLPDKLQITEDGTAKKIRIQEESLFGKVYTETYDDVCKTCKEMFSDFLINQKFWNILRDIKNNPNFHRKRVLDISKPDSAGKDYYTKAVYDEMSKHYTKE
jgi:hypothetical protein